MINLLRSKIDFKASRSPYETSNPDVSMRGTHARGFCFSDSLEEKAVSKPTTFTATKSVSLER